MIRVVFLTDFSEEYAKNILKGISRYAKETEPWGLFRLPLSIRDKYGISEVIRWAKKVKADAVIGQFYNDDNVSLFKENGILAIAQDFKRRFSEIPNITGDHILAGNMCAEYYINKGFKNFAFYGRRDVVWSEERALGFKETISKVANHTYSEFRSDLVHDLWYYDSSELLRWLESLPKPVAIMACDDNQAYQTTEACLQSNNCRIPYDIAVIGVDNDETVCELSIPNLSSLEQSIEQGGYDVARFIDNKLHKPDYPDHDIIVRPNRIITRHSTDIYANSDKSIATVMRYIHSNINHKLTIEDIVAQVPHSRRLLEIKFKKEIGMSIYDYITHTRVEKIAQMLMECDSVSEAAASVGIWDLKNMSRIFKKVYGMTPSEYKKINSVPEK